MTRQEPSKQCPGDGVRGCLTTIPVTRARCRFCTRTVRLRAVADGTLMAAGAAGGVAMLAFGLYALLAGR